MLITLADMKDYLGETGTTYDDFLTEQLEIISDAIEKYCGRSFITKSYTQTIYRDQFENRDDKTIYLASYPLVAITSIELDGVAVTGYRVEYGPGKIFKIDGFINTGDELVIEYTAGTTEVPRPIRQAIYSIVEEKYNKKKSGVSINFGSDVQSISIPGTVSISYDYSLQGNERKNAFGTILGNYVNILDMYRTERRIVGKLEETRYVQ